MEKPIDQSTKEPPMIYQDKDKIYYVGTCEPSIAAARRNEISLSGWGRGHYPGEPIPDNKLPHLRAVGVWDAKTDQKWGLDRHCNEGIEITYVAKGKIPFEVDDSSWLLRRGNFAITRPWQFHKVGNPNVPASRYIWLIIDVGVRRPNQEWEWPNWLMYSQEETKSRLSQLMRQNEHPVWNANTAISQNFEYIANLVENQSFEQGETEVLLRINQLLFDIFDLVKKSNNELDHYLSTTYRSVELFLNSIERYIEHSWTVKEMATQCGLSCTQFTTYCKQITNMSPMEFLNIRRLDAAANLILAKPKEHITDICFTCGFNSSQYFSRKFKEKYGVSPIEYRTQKQPN
jgi:AraC-like DNA-binding protein